VTAAPAQVDKSGGQHGLDQTGQNKHAGGNGQIGFHEHVGLGLAGKHGEGQSRTAGGKYQTGQHGLGDGALPYCMGQCLACMLRDKVQPTAYGADQRQRNEPDKFQVAHLGGLEPGHAHAAAHKLAKQQVGAQAAGNRDTVDHGLLRLGQLDRDLVGRGLIVISTLAVGATSERCHKTKDGRGKERRQGSLGAQQRKLPKLGAKATHAVADPAAQTSDNAGQAGLRSNTSTKQQRQQCRERKLAQVVVRVAPVLLNLSHHLVKVIGLGARHLFVQTNQQAAQQADEKRVRQKAKRAAGEFGRRDTQCVRDLGPQIINAVLHRKKEQPDRGTCERTGHGNAN